MNMIILSILSLRFHVLRGRLEVGYKWTYILSNRMAMIIFPTPVYIDP